MEKDTHIQLKRLSTDEAYFTNVFKKTEKLVSVIFYILSHIDKRQKDNIHLEKIRNRALETHERALDTLSYQSSEVFEGLLSFQYQLLALESTLRIAEAARLLDEGIMRMLFEQLDGIQRYINNHYTREQGYSIDIADQSATLPGGEKGRELAAKKSSNNSPRRKRVQIPAGDISTDAYLVYSQMTDRGERIRTVLEAKPQATIKDIAEVITDVSEKTIQRELNSLIEKGQVIREGERRWSKYSVAKS